MTYLPQTPAHWRSPRAQLADITPAVLRLPDGRGSRGTLQTISLTGGLLSMANPLDRGSRANLMFLTASGPFLGEAEMLTPVSPTCQPFRFVALEELAQRRLRTIIESSLHRGEQEWIEKYRAALDQEAAPRPSFLRVALRAVFITLCLGSTLFLVHLYLPR